MSQVAEKQTLHSVASELQPWHYGVACVLGFLAFNPEKWPFVLITLAVGYGVWVTSEKKREARENAARLSGVVNFVAVEVVGSQWVTETVEDVAARAAKIRQDIKDSGNMYADIIQVVEFPYSPMLVGVGQLSLSWPAYKRQLAEFQHMKNIEFFEGKCPAHLKATFASQVLPAPKSGVEI